MWQVSEILGFYRYVDSQQILSEVDAYLHHIIWATS